MRRAHRHYVPGHVWYVTRRCQKRECLLKFARQTRPANKRTPMTLFADCIVGFCSESRMHSTRGEKADTHHLP